MSLYGYLACLDCRSIVWLGKAVFSSEDPANQQVEYFHVGASTEPSNWTREELNRRLWTMLARHRGHHLQVLLDYELAELADRNGEFHEEEFSTHVKPP